MQAEQAPPAALLGALDPTCTIRSPARSAGPRPSLSYLFPGPAEQPQPPQPQSLGAQQQPGSASAPSARPPPVPTPQQQEAVSEQPGLGHAQSLPPMWSGPGGRMPETAAFLMQSAAGSPGASRLTPLLVVPVPEAGTFTVGACP